MVWWAWIAVGALLLGAELTTVSAEFYLVFVGSAALVVGLGQLGGLGLAIWLQWSLFAAIAASSMIFFRRRIYERLRSHLPYVGGGLVGESVTLPIALPPGETCRLEYRGAPWSAVNAGLGTIPAGGKARIGRVEALTLVLYAEP
jgi:membrane protein implicated in regulation of membrane protease activity